MDHPYFFGIMFRHVAKTEQPCRDVVQVRIGLIWWHIGITFTSGLCTSNAAGQGRFAALSPQTHTSGRFGPETPLLRDPGPNG